MMMVALAPAVLLARAAPLTRIVLGSVQVYYVGNVVLSRPVWILTLGSRLCQLEWAACDCHIVILSYSFS